MNDIDKIFVAVVVKKTFILNDLYRYSQNVNSVALWLGCDVCQKLKSYIIISREAELRSLGFS